MPQFPFEYPADMKPHLDLVAKGEYDVAYDNQAPVILDVGANIGAFAVWASVRWPGSTLHCYEPLPSNFALLEKNTAPLRSRVQLHNVAVGKPGLRKLYLGQNNCGEASFFDLGEQQATSVKVETVAPKMLPVANIIKLDTEGAEVEILSGLFKAGREFDAVLLEYHSEDNRRAADQLLPQYTLVGFTPNPYYPSGRGVMKYVNSRHFA